MVVPPVKLLYYSSILIICGYLVSSEAEEAEGKEDKEDKEGRSRKIKDIRRHSKTYL